MKAIALVSPRRRNNTSWSRPEVDGSNEVLISVHFEGYPTTQYYRKSREDTYLYSDLPSPLVWTDSSRGLVVRAPQAECPFEMLRRTAPNLRAIMFTISLMGLFDSTTPHRRFVAQGFVVKAELGTDVSPFFVGRTARPQRRSSCRDSIVSKGEPRCPSLPLHQQNKDPQQEVDVGAPKAETFESTDLASRGLVSILTSLVNSVTERLPDQSSQSTGKPALSSMERAVNPPSERAYASALDNQSNGSQQVPNRPPRTPDELLDRIRNDYTANNYLWTGNLDVSAFDPQCAFQDPTLSFRGTDKFVRNVRNLRPFVDAVATSCRSDLLSICLNDDDGYVQTRWNMVGDLRRLPWKPQINVVGRTKFWYRSAPLLPSTDEATAHRGSEVDETAVVVVRYDEEWEIPAYRALLQLVTPGSEP
jgi:Uncharacterized conserved protein (DUF2358)